MKLPMDMISRIAKQKTARLTRRNRRKAARKGETAFCEVRSTSSICSGDAVPSTRSVSVVSMLSSHFIARRSRGVARNTAALAPARRVGLLRDLDARIEQTVDDVYDRVHDSDGDSHQQNGALHHWHVLVNNR